jgi:hypothetical protein
MILRGWLLLGFVCMFFHWIAEICKTFRHLAKGRFVSSWLADASPSGDYFRSIVTALVKSPKHQLSVSDPIVAKHWHDILPHLLAKRTIAIRRSTQLFILS